MKQKGLAPILIILLIAVMAVGGYLIYQKQTKPVVVPQPVASTVASSSAETATWKTYENKKIEVSFKYPVDWITKTYQFEGYEAYHAVIALDSVKAGEQGPEPGILTFAYWDNPDNLSLEQFEKKYTGNSGMGPGVYSSKLVTKTISEVTAYYQKDALCEPVHCDKYIIPYKDKIFEFISFKVSQRTIFDQILSTFKFTQ